MMKSFFTQTFPSRPRYTEDDIDFLNGKVYIVTGGNAGLGLEIVKVLYAKGAKVYIAGRSLSRMSAAVENVKANISSATGEIKALYVDLNDLTTIAKCVADFLDQEHRLDVVWNNAGITEAPPGTLTVQGYEAHMGINCVAPYLLTKMLLPILAQTAATVPEASVRVVFTSSQIIDLQGPPGGISISELDTPDVAVSAEHCYSASKAGNWMMASEFDRRYHDTGIVFLTYNPGNLRTTDWNSASRLSKLAFGLILYPAKYGAYTALWAGLSQDVKQADGGKYAVPWGRWHPTPRKDVVVSLRSEAEGGTGVASRFWDWCNQQTVRYEASSIAP